jgi:uncharacterized C2H2 Zn-finger protein
MKCKKEFKKKSHYLDHLNKKFSCIKNPEILFDTPEKLPKKTENEEKINKIIENNENNEILNLNCQFCGIIFNRKDNLNRHIKDRCKVKKLQDEEKENIFKILLAKDEQNKKQESEIKELKEYIKNITNMNLDLNNKVNKLIEKISIGNINKGVINNNTNNINNNIIITTDQLCNFGFEDIKQIDTQLFKNLNGKFGKEIFIECAKNIFNTLSKNKTLYFSDLSREKAMAWDKGQWNLIPMDKAINTINDQIRAYFKHNESNYERLKIPEVKKNYDETIKKYYKMYYQEYDKTDRYEPPQSRLDEFNRVVLNGLKEFFYNIKEDVKNNYEQIQKKILDSNLLNKIEYIPEKKPRGRPKKVIEPVIEDTKPKKLIETNIKNEPESDSDDLVIVKRRPINKKYLL